MSQLSLFPRQMDFVRDPRRFPAAIGGIGSGKTFVGAAKVVSRLARPELGIVFAPTYKMLRDSTQRTMFTMLRDLGISYSFNASNNHLTITRSGHEILFRSLDDPDNVRGPNAAYAWVDEAAYITEKAWRIVKGRVRVGDLQQIWITTTPRGRNWIWREWVKDPTDRHELYRFRTDENPTLDTEYAESLGYTGKFAEQELGGEFVSFEGLVYGGFDREKHVKRVDTTGWINYLGADIGHRNPTSILTISFGAGDRVHIGREFYERNLGNREIEDAILEEYDLVMPEFVFIDPSAASLIVDLENQDVPVYKANNDIRSGIRTVSSYINDNRLTIDPSCIHTIAEMESYQYPENRPEEDRPMKVNDHSMDTMRYVIHTSTDLIPLDEASSDLDELLAGQAGLLR